VVVVVLRPLPVVAQKKPLHTLPYTPSLEPSFMDRTADPCTDFYKYSCGGWIKKNPIPPDQARWSVYGKVHDEIQQYLWGLLEEASRPVANRSPARQKIGDFFSSCMDERTVEKLGAAPIKSDLDSLAALTGKDALPRWLASAHLRIADDMEFSFGANQDPGDS